MLYFSQIIQFVCDFFIPVTVLCPPVLRADNWLQAWNSFSTLLVRQARIPESSCRIALSCGKQCWADQEVTRGVMVHALLVNIQHFHATVFTLQRGSAERMLSLISRSSVFQWYVFLDAAEGSHWFFGFVFLRGLLTCCLFSSISVSFSRVFLLHWEERAVHVHSFSWSCLHCLEKTNFP